MLNSDASENIHGENVQKIVEAQLRQYPQSSLKDIYKSFFQDEYGPGHLLSDEGTARRYFDLELSEMKSKGYYVDEPCGTGNQFYRVSLDKVKDGKVHPDNYFNVFLQSSADFSLPEIETWSFKWIRILESIIPFKNQIKDFKTDREWISHLLRNGKYVVHHSDEYNRTYDPHYRIIKKKLLI